jgi:DNA-binding transcriptional regulator YbjK
MTIPRQTPAGAPAGPPEGRRALILEATLRLIAEGGVDSVTHRRVAKAAGVSLSATTYYFDSREHLLREAFRHWIERAKAQQSRLGEAFRDPGADRIADFLVALGEAEVAAPDLMLAEYELTLFAARDPESAEALHEWDDWMVAQLGQRLESLGATRPFAGARTLLHLMRGYELHRLAHREPDAGDLRRRLEVVVSAILGAGPVASSER